MQAAAATAPRITAHATFYPERITLTIGDLAEIFHVAPSTIYSSRSQPDGRGQFPEPLLIPGSNRLLWLRDDVIAFLENCRASRENRRVKNRQGAGRPTKLEQHAAAAAGLTVREWRAAQMEGRAK